MRRVENGKPYVDWAHDPRNPANMDTGAAE